jgi:hypothetical protein
LIVAGDLRQAVEILDAEPCDPLLIARIVAVLLGRKRLGPIRNLAGAGAGPGALGAGAGPGAGAGALGAGAGALGAGAGPGVVQQIGRSVKPRKR